MAENKDQKSSACVNVNEKTIIPPAPPASNNNSNNFAQQLPYTKQQEQAEAGLPTSEQTVKDHISAPDQAEIFFEQCIEALKGPSDEHRFVGLLLLAKILPKLKENKKLFHDIEGKSSLSIRQRVFDAIGPLFLKRLFAANDYTNDGDNEEEYRELALLVLSFLLEEKNVAKVFIDFTSKFFLNLHNNKTSKMETLKCLVSLCRVSPKVVTGYVLGYGNNQNVETSQVDVGKQYNFLKLLCDDILLNQKYENNIAIKYSTMYLLYHMINCYRNKILLNANNFNKCIFTLGYVFATVTKDKTVFMAVDCLALLLNNAMFEKEGDNTENNLDKDQDKAMEALIGYVKGQTKKSERRWHCDIFKGVLHMLKSKIPLDTRSKVFKIIHFMLMYEEENWGLGNDLIILKERTMDEAQKLKDLFPMLLAKSTMIEARVNMDLIARLIIDCNDIDTHDTKNQKAEDRNECLVVLSCCYGIVERCVQFLVSEEEDHNKWNSLKPTTLLSLRDSFIDIIQTGISLIDYLYKALVRNQSLTNTFLQDTKRLKLLEIIFRLLSTWLSVDAVSVAERLLNTLPAMENIFLNLDPKNPKHRVVMEYSLPTLTILLDDYNAIIEFQECKKMFKKVYELDFETKKRYEITGDHNKEGNDEAIFIRRLLEHFRR